MKILIKLLLLASFIIADNNNHRIRKIGSDGIITTIAGTGEQGTTGDNGLATIAKIKHPYNRQ